MAYILSFLFSLARLLSHALPSLSRTGVTPLLTEISEDVFASLFLSADLPLQLAVLDPLKNMGKLGARMIAHFQQVIAS